MVKNLLTMQETWVRFLGGEDPLEKEMATHPSILAWRISWTGETDALGSMGSQSRTRLSDFTFLFLSFPCVLRINIVSFGCDCPIC